MRERAVSMGNKVHPVGMRLGMGGEVNESKLRWFPGKQRNFVPQVQNDIKAIMFINKHYKQAGIRDVKIDRPGNQVSIKIYCAKPGILIGHRGGDVEKIRRQMTTLLQMKASVSVVEVKKIDLEAKLVAELIASSLERRVSFRKVMKKAIQNTMRAGAKGVKVAAAGRLSGAEIARTEWYKEGRVPLHTLKADISYYCAEAKTTYGIIGVKVWIYRGDVDLRSKSQTENGRI